MKLDENRAYEVTGESILPATQALDETDTEVSFLSFGVLTKVPIKSIEEACEECGSWKKRGGLKECRSIQKRDSVVRGFQKLICPNQFIEE